MQISDIRSYYAIHINIKKHIQKDVLFELITSIKFPVANKQIFMQILFSQSRRLSKKKISTTSAVV